MTIKQPYSTLASHFDPHGGASNVLLERFHLDLSSRWLTHTGNDWLNVIGPHDRAVMSGVPGNQLQALDFHTSGGTSLLESKVQDLVTAMAGFALPAVGQTSGPMHYKPSITPIIAVDGGL